MARKRKSRKVRKRKKKKQKWFVVRDKPPGYYFPEEIERWYPAKYTPKDILDFWKREGKIVKIKFE